MIRIFVIKEIFQFILTVSQSEPILTGISTLRDELNSYLFWSGGSHAEEMSGQGWGDGERASEGVSPGVWYPVSSINICEI